MIKRITEPALLLALFGLIYYGPIQVSKLPVFAGEFNNLDGSLYVVRFFDTVLSAGLVLLVSRYLIPNRLDLKTIFKIIVGLITVLLSASILEWGWDALTLSVFNLPTGPGEISDKMLLYTRRETLNLSILWGNLLVLSGGVFYGLIRDRNNQIRQHERLEIQNLEAEVKYLRSQINPHFLFNILNNIFAITQRNDDQEGSDAVLRLSGLMRYMLYDSVGDNIGLNQEVEHLKDYIDLMLLKYKTDKRPEVDFRIEGDPKSFRVEPLILLPFVENAFKHGIDSKGKGSIKISLVSSDRTLNFSVTNTRFPDRTASSEHKGIGLDNVKRRLEHHYPEKHQLDIRQSEDEYQVKLRIKL